MSTNRDQEIKRFFRDFKKMPDGVRKQARPMLRQTAQEPLADARKNASWSTRIPGATRISLRFSRRFSGVTLYVNRRKAPHARAFENQGKPGQFRHRVYGKDVWVNQSARPFFYEVSGEWHSNVIKNLGEVVDQVTRDHGFK